MSASIDFGRQPACHRRRRPVKCYSARRKGGRGRKEGEFAEVCRAERVRPRRIEPSSLRGEGRCHRRPKTRSCGEGEREEGSLSSSLYTFILFYQLSCLMTLIYIGRYEGEIDGEEGGGKGGRKKKEEDNAGLEHRPFARLF